MDEPTLAPSTTASRATVAGMVDAAASALLCHARRPSGLRSAGSDEADSGSTRDTLDAGTEAMEAFIARLASRDRAVDLDPADGVGAIGVRGSGGGELGNDRVSCGSVDATICGGAGSSSGKPPAHASVAAKLVSHASAVRSTARLLVASCEYLSLNISCRGEGDLRTSVLGACAAAADVLALLCWDAGAARCAAMHGSAVPLMWLCQAAAKLTASETAEGAGASDVDSMPWQAAADSAGEALATMEAVDAHTTAGAGSAEVVLARAVGHSSKNRDIVAMVATEASENCAFAEYDHETCTLALRIGSTGLVGFAESETPVVDSARRALRDWFYVSETPSPVFAATGGCACAAPQAWYARVLAAAGLDALHQRNDSGGAGRVLVLGVGAGTICTFLAHHGPTDRRTDTEMPIVTGVEVDAGVLRLAEHVWGTARSGRLDIVHADAYSFVYGCHDAIYDAVLVDLYSQGDIPDWLTHDGTMERLVNLTRRDDSGKVLGIVAVNAGHRSARLGKLMKAATADEPVVLQAPRLESSHATSAVPDDSVVVLSRPVTLDNIDGSGILLSTAFQSTRRPMHAGAT